jgi:hypothetical protein
MEVKFDFHALVNDSPFAAQEGGPPFVKPVNPRQAIQNEPRARVR